MRQTPVIATAVLVTALLPAVPAAADPGDPELRPVDGALVPGTEPVHAESTTSEVTDLTLDGGSLESRPVFSGEPFAFVFEGNGLNVHYVNGVEVGGHRVYTLDGVNGFSTEELVLEAEWLSPGENEITLFTGTRPGICNMDDFDVCNVRLRTPDGTEIVDPANTIWTDTTLTDPAEVGALLPAGNAAAGSRPCWHGSRCSAGWPSSSADWYWPAEPRFFSAPTL